MGNGAANVGGSNLLGASGPDSPTFFHPQVVEAYHISVPLIDAVIFDARGPTRRKDFAGEYETVDD